MLKTMKSKLHLILVCSLMSCQFSPANASTNNLTFCDDLKDLAVATMNLRQQGIEKYVVEGLLSRPTQGEEYANSITKSIVDIVYEYPLFKQEALKKEVSVLAGKHIYLVCKGV